jgi:hypothetical protein
MNNQQAYILGVCLIISSIIFGSYIYKAKQTRDWISVVGVSTKSAESDSAKLIVNITKNTTTDSYNVAYQSLQNEADNLKKAFIEKGIEDKNIMIQSISSVQDYNNKNYYTLTQTIELQSSKIDLIEGISKNINSQVKSEFMVNSDLQYFVNKDLSSIKRELIAAATEDAKKRAEAIAKISKRSVGKIRSVSTGVFQITEPLSTEVSDYGIYSTRTKGKNLSITINASFELR